MNLPFGEKLISCACNYDGIHGEDDEFVFGGQSKMSFCIAEKALIIIDLIFMALLLYQINLYTKVR